MRIANWDFSAKKHLLKIIKAASKYPQLKKQGPKLSWKIEVHGVTQKTMQRINYSYCHKKKVTDVLSFPAPRVFYEKGLLGEIVICVPILKKQACFFKHTPQQELKILLIHGFLHLLGFDHEKSKRDALKMAYWETVLLNQSPGLIERGVWGTSKE
jgi:rRNA maturation RNase YbeY